MTISRDHLTVEELREILHRYDLITRPKALMLSPEMKEALLQAEPDIEEKIVLVAALGMDNHAYLIDRTELEHMGWYAIESETENGN